ncbi:hypothetical protein [Piscinibacter sp.]|uniref:hypothetical protein n=1 Tax=Piscinibacter sp. TaxID=1903157 RepID=UPI001D47D725|nr:hypothetical protein [Piscinibacter sp.]MBK7530336.1 hypothetical protein [Piscinibacter sp.]
MLDREFSPELQQELDLIESGQAPAAGDRQAAPGRECRRAVDRQVCSLAYNRHARQLRASDRGGAIQAALVDVAQAGQHVAARRVMASESLRGGPSHGADHALGSGVSSTKVFEGMTRELVDQVVASIIGRTFPITVVALEGGNVVLSQGAGRCRAVRAYAMVTMGTEMKDPADGPEPGPARSPAASW